jgi:histidinol phosphatase-like enzyme
MAKLLIIDKDSTLTIPKSGAEFVQHPEDQELLPGVKDQIERYHSEGWRIVVASNQGGCAQQWINASDLKPGMLYKGFDGIDHKVRGVNVYLNEGYTSAVFDPDTIGLLSGDRLTWPNSRKIRIAWKTEKDAIAEMRYLMDLLPEIDTCLFCPELIFGESCWQIKPDGTTLEWRDQLLIEKPNHGACSPPTPRSIGCRKPNPGMLMVAIEIYRPTDVLMVGDRPEDQGCAEAAGVAFQWAYQFFGGSNA